MTVFVAEFTTNHMGNLNVLLRMVERAVWAGCSYIKMQKKDVESFYSKEKLESPYESPYGRTYRDYRTMFEFGEEDWDRFDHACRELGVEWFCTAQDIPSLHFMLRYDLPCYKIASSNARDRGFLEEMARIIPHDKTIVMSVGGSTLQQVEDSLKIFNNHPVWLLHCVAQYPCSPDALRLGNIRALRRNFADDRVRIGYSGHEEGFIPSLAAIDMGAEVVERHFCLSRYSFVHHIECSLEPEEYREMVETVHAGWCSAKVRESLPAEAYATYFGMSDVERTFLVEQTYGRKYLGQQARFQPGGATAASGEPMDDAERRESVVAAGSHRRKVLTR